MNDLFETKSIKPMLIGESAEAFDSPDFIYELKMDGERCIAYLDPAAGPELRNKRNMKMLPKMPELAAIHTQAKRRCILDGELAVLVNGKPSFYEIQRRSLTSNNFKIHLQSQKLPACFIAFDVLYDNGYQTVRQPLIERKELLRNLVADSPRLAVSRFVEGRGISFYQLAEQQELEGIVAKRRDSKYFFDKRTKDWIKIKNLQDDDFVVCGYIEKGQGVISVVLGQYSKDDLLYKGHVTLGVSSQDFRAMSSAKRLSRSPFRNTPEGNENAVWLAPELVCVVKYMMKTDSGSLRQPVFKGLRQDKAAKDCVVADIT